MSKEDSPNTPPAGPADGGAPNGKDEPRPFAPLGRLLRLRREEMKLTQEQVGEACGLERFSVWAWETGRRHPSEHSGRVARALRVTVDSLYSDGLDQPDAPGPFPAALTPEPGPDGLPAQPEPRTDLADEAPMTAEHAAIQRSALARRLLSGEPLDNATLVSALMYQNMVLAEGEQQERNLRRREQGLRQMELQSRLDREQDLRDALDLRGSRAPLPAEPEGGASTGKGNGSAPRSSPGRSVS